MVRISQRDILPSSAQKRHLDLIRTSDTISASAILASGQGTIFNLKAESKSAVPVITQEDISLYEASVTDANLIPNGSSIDMSDYQVIGPWRDKNSGDGKNISTKIFIKNLQGTADFSVEVSSSGDDGYETNNSSWTSNTATMKVGEDNVTADDYDIGIRFQNITIPKSSLINLATLYFTYNADTGGTEASATIYGVDEDNCVAFSSGNLPSSRDRTTANLFAQDFSPFPMQDQIETSVTVTNIVQEIIDRAGWASGNALGFYFNGRAVGGYNAFYAQDNGSLKPRLEINYSENTSKTIIFRGRTRYLSEARDDIAVKTTVLLTKRVVSSSDDAHGNPAPFYSDTADSVILGEDAAAWTSGFRFTNITIPKNSTIISAKLTLLPFITTNSAGDAVLKYYADAADNSATFSSGDKPSDRTKTASFATQTYTTPPSIGITFNSSDLSAVIQEVINRTNWISGNALSIIVDGADSDANNSISCVSYDKDTTNAALLTVEYE